MSTEDPDKDILEQAALWAGRMNEHGEPLSAVEQARFQDWILADPRHERAYRAFVGISMMAAELPADARAHLKLWAAENGGERAASRRHVVKWALAAGVAGAVVLGGGYLLESQGVFASEVVTRAGETRTVTFEEGSVAYLNSKSRVRWLGDERDRRVELLQGEALFDVVHDEARPFRVMLGDSEIQVLGTRFDVNRKSGGEVIVTVLEGTVQVRGYASGAAKSDWTRTLNTDEQMAYRPIGLTEEPHQTVALNAVAWRQGIVQFEGKPLKEVVEDLTRYTDQPIQIRDASIANIKVGGALSTKNVRKALERLRETAPEPIAINEENGVITLVSGKKHDSVNDTGKQP
ncbi:MAG TPA: FecR domain-containing protein [Steroidobacteraceae bacterium]|jgi:transmembrane sensor